MTAAVVLNSASAPSRSFWQRRVVALIVAQLKQGITLLLPALRGLASRLGTVGR